MTLNQQRKMKILFYKSLMYSGASSKDVNISELQGLQVIAKNEVDFEDFNIICEFNPYFISILARALNTGYGKIRLLFVKNKTHNIDLFINKIESIFKDENDLLNKVSFIKESRNKDRKFRKLKFRLLEQISIDKFIIKPLVDSILNKPYTL